MHIYADQISQVSLSNNNLRITLSQRGPDNSTVEVGTLIVPASQANNFVNGLAKSLKELDEKLKAAKEGQTEQ
jgi:DTW domain-containing protein YfiP